MTHAAEPNECSSLYAYAMKHESVSTGLYEAQVEVMMRLNTGLYNDVMIHKDYFHGTI